MTADPADVVVVGGGPAGAAAACVLAAAGRAVTLIERERGPHDKVCGEFVSAEAIAHLHTLGIDPAAHGAVAIDAVRLAAGRLSARAALPFPACGVTRRTLDAALLARAAALGVTVRLGVAARTIVPRDAAGMAAVRLGGGESLSAPDVVLATGKHDLAGLGRPAPPAALALVGLKMHYRLGAAAAAALDRDVGLFLFDGHYAGIQRVAADVANLCLLAPAAALRASGGGWAGLLDRMLARAPLLAAWLRGAAPLWPAPLAVARVPYGFVHRPDPAMPGIWRVGDQAAVTPSFTGDGLAIALATGSQAARTCLAGGSASDYHATLARGAVGRQVARAGLLSRALLSPRLQAPALGLARCAPGLLRAGARLTRLAG